MVTTVITVTSCENNACSDVPVTTGVTVVAKDETTYTTYCPLADEGASKSQNTEVLTSVGVNETGTAVITVLSCDDTSCSYVPKTTGAGYNYNDPTLTPPIIHYPNKRSLLQAQTHLPLIHLVLHWIILKHHRLIRTDFLLLGLQPIKRLHPLLLPTQLIQLRLPVHLEVLLLRPLLLKVLLL